MPEKGQRKHKERENIGFQQEKGYIHNEVVSKDVVNTCSITGSSDIGDVSWLMPFSVLLTAAWSIGVNAVLLENHGRRSNQGVIIWN